jgi:ABC-type lipoprotein release transport system permease subunit
MSFTDIVALAWRNLRQAKLRTSLTVIGVVVGVAAIITMVSFGIGLRQNIIGQALGRLDVFTAMTVFGADTNDMLALSGGRTALDDDEDAEEESAGQQGAASPNGSPTPSSMPARSRRRLDDDALAEISKLDGVSFAVPIVNFPGFVRFNDRTRQSWAVGARAGDDPRLRNLLAGRGFNTEDADEVVVKESFLEGYSEEAFQRRRNRRGNPGGPFRQVSTKSDEERKRAAQAALGKEITLYSPPTDDAAPASVFGIPLLDLPNNFRANNPRTRSGARGDGDHDELPNQSDFDRHVFRIVGVVKSEEGIGLPTFGGSDFYLPLETAKRLREANRSPMERMGEALTGNSGYLGAELRVSDPSRIKPVTKSLADLGFRAFSLANQLEEIERVFLIVNSSLALIGGIALLVASFGISNTMIMSIRERTREIGVMKAIGGSDGEIMRIFFVEASLIGLTGGVLGVIGGWGIDRVANTLANRWVLRQAGQAIRHIEFFSIPWYLSGGAILFAVTISLVAAIYPAMRAARVDPIKALRYE